MNARSFAIALLVLHAGLFPAGAQQEIKPPFGMQWGETPGRIKEVVGKGGAKVMEERESGPRDLIVVEGIVQEGLKRTLFYFSNGGLSEVELQYDRPNWEEDKVADWVSTIKASWDKKYGAGRLYADEKGDENGLVHTLKGWMWVQNFVSLRLVHYTAQKGEEKMRRVSVHYCAE
ncbi:MAG: hypothetical protein FGM15_05670 [Chthoniobacterales bacterium]|nr:hypothetical protein [Chthoniobacterales bacterium]